MPHDNLSLSLRPPSSDEPKHSTATELQVMTRLVRLPTGSLRQARRIVGLQLDRLSPLPAAETAFDLVQVRQEGAETAYALGIVRRVHLTDPAYANRRQIVLKRTVDNAEVLFRFRNPNAIDDREARWFKHAPNAARIVLGLTFVMAAVAYRVDDWQSQRLVEISAQQREATRSVLNADLETSARADWLNLERADAATRLLCVAQKVSALERGSITLLGYAGEANELLLRLPEGVSTSSLLEAGGTEQGSPSVIVFKQDVCG